MKATEIALKKPFLRGHFHQAAFFIALGASSMLVAVAEGARVRAVAAVYAVTLAGLFGVSGLYHRNQWKPRGYMLMKRLDHSAIFTLIAGTATPVCLLGMRDPAGVRLLTVIWTAAILGILKEVFWVHSHRYITVIGYLAVSAVSVPYIPEMASALGTEKLALIVLGGIIYVVGALVYAFKRPDPAPAVFGYHEIFHALVVIASVLHFVVVYQLIRTV